VGKLNSTYSFSMHLKSERLKQKCVLLFLLGHDFYFFLINNEVCREFLVKLELFHNV